MWNTRNNAARLLAALVIVSAGACTTEPNDGDDDDIDPEVTQDYLERNFAKIPRITDALVRIIATVNGNPQTGVTFVPITNGVQGTVGVDLDNNGSMETTVNATVVFINPSLGLAGGAHLTVTAIDAASTTGTASADIQLQGSSTVVFSDGEALLFPTEGPSEIEVSNGNITATASLTSPLLIGSADFSAGSTSGTAFFESNGAGGFRIRITSPNFETFTVP
jgi:hypothetical protein